MSVADRRQREKVALRQQILAAARDLFAQEGYESVSMRKVAEKIDYSPTVIYTYFQDKHELINELCEETFALLTRKVEKSIKSGKDPIDCLKRGLRAYVDFGLQHPNHYQTTFLTVHHEEPVEKSMGSHGMRAFMCLVQGVTECVQAGLFREKDVEAISQSLWCTIHGVTSLQITHCEGFPWVEQGRLIDLTIDAAVRGFMR